MIKLFKLPNCQKFLYRVSKEDTLESIALKYGLNPQKILHENNIQNIYEGLVLFLNTSNKKTYIVKPLDTIQSISKKLGVSQETLIKENGITQIYIGQKIEY